MVERMAYSNRTTMVTEPTFAPIHSWDSWRPHVAWKSMLSRGTFAINDVTYKKTTPKLVLQTLKADVFFFN